VAKSRQGEFNFPAINREGLAALRAVLFPATARSHWATTSCKAHVPYSESRKANP
jgi:hypothetical protein